MSEIQLEPTERTKPKKKKWKIALYSSLGTLILLGAIGAYAYNRLQPTHHFKQTSLPVVASPSSTPAAETQKYPQLQDGEFNVLLLGGDERAQDEAARTDTIMVIHVNLNNHDYEVISIPRDTRVNLPGYGETKITHANYMGELKGGLSQGTKDTIQAVSNLTGLNINYYAETSFSGLTQMVDTVGGVDVDLPFDVPLEDANHTVYKKGINHVDGKTLLALTRERHTLDNGDFGRQQIQAEAVLALTKKLASSAEISNLPRLINQLSNFLVTTNMSTQDMLSFALGLKGINSTQVHYYQVPGYSAMMMDPIVGQKLWYWIADDAGLHEIIQEHFVN